MRARLFTDYWSFRIVSPVATGTIVYLLILLINNTIEDALESFISDEFFVCIALALIVSETTRLILKQFSKINLNIPDAWKVVTIILITVLCTSLLVCIGISSYFRYALGYQPNLSELQPFIILYAGLTIALAAVYLSNYFIKKASSEMILVEEQLKDQSAANFIKLTRGINPDLLFESLESLITHVQDNDADEADNMIDDLSMVYRYTLSKNSKEIISIQEELRALSSLAQLINRLPYRKTKIVNNLSGSGYIIPGSLLHLIEIIIKKTIVSQHKTLTITITNEEKNISVSYIPHDKLNNTLSIEDLQNINLTYSMYSEQQVQIKEQDEQRSILLPLLSFKTEST